LVVMFAAIYARASTWFRDLRCAAGQAYETGKREQPAERRRKARGADRVESADGDRGDRYGGLVLILWLMVMKPF
jgi:hypothetical protein